MSYSHTSKKRIDEFTRLERQAREGEWKDAEVMKRLLNAAEFTERNMAGNLATGESGLIPLSRSMRKETAEKLAEFALQKLGISLIPGKIAFEVNATFTKMQSATRLAMQKSDIGRARAEGIPITDENTAKSRSR